MTNTKGMDTTKQTAIEWLGNEITNRITRRNPHDTIIIQILGETLIELIEQAKEIEKERVIQFADKYDLHCRHIYLGRLKTPEQYYNETYGGNN
jgi:hypothetical protein